MIASGTMHGGDCARPPGDSTWMLNCTDLAVGTSVDVKTSCGARRAVALVKLLDQLSRDMREGHIGEPGARIAECGGNP